LCDEIKKERLNIKFWVDACIETTDTQSLKVLKESGCIGVNFGLESLDTNYLRYTKKVKYTSYYHKKCFKLIDFCKKIGLGYTLYYMIGFPGQTKNEIDKQLKFLKKYHIWNYVYVPFLGTLEYERVKNDIVENDYSKYDCVHQVIKTKIPDNYIKKIIIYQYINSLIGYLLDKLRME
ncbi:MAG: hypothetical protein QXP04_01640, partial [Candidatus Nanoarchaeia archaeon]|nr:hypothetical protein [Candidatus Jingweiarchaeum tengchongense]